jgi:hypothetical protein
VEDVVCPTVVGTDGKLNVFPCCFCSTGVRTVHAPTKAMLRVAVWCVNRSSPRQTYAAQQPLMTVVPSGIHVLTSNVLVEWSGTGTRKVLPDSRLTPANTHVVLRSLPRLCWRLPKQFHPFSQSSQAPPPRFSEEPAMKSNTVLRPFSGGAEVNSQVRDR